MPSFKDALVTSRTMGYLKNKKERNKAKRKAAMDFSTKLLCFFLWLVWIIPAGLFFYLPRFAWRKFDLWWNRTQTGFHKKTRHMKNSARHQAVSNG